MKVSMIVSRWFESRGGIQRAPSHRNRALRMMTIAKSSSANVAAIHQARYTRVWSKLIAGWTTGHGYFLHGVTHAELTRRLTKRLN
jgi:hypothetical protein